MNKPLILVVEDDAPIRNLITTTLKTQDYKYIAAATASEALQQATINAPDVMLLDLGLPDLDGIEVIRRIRSWSAMPIIVISARSEDSDKIEALDSGADVYKRQALPPRDKQAGAQNHTQLDLLAQYPIYDRHGSSHSFFAMYRENASVKASL